MSSLKSELTHRTVHRYTFQRGRFNTLTELNLSECVTRVSQKCDGQHEKTVLSHKGNSKAGI